MALNDDDFAGMVLECLADFGVAVTVRHAVSSPTLGISTGKLTHANTAYALMMIPGAVRDQLVGEGRKRVAYRDYYADAADLAALAGAPVIDRQDTIVHGAEEWRIVRREPLAAGKAVKFTGQLVLGKE